MDIQIITVNQRPDRKVHNSGGLILGRGRFSLAEPLPHISHLEDDIGREAANPAFPTVKLAFHGDYSPRLAHQTSLELAQARFVRYSAEVIPGIAVFVQPPDNLPLESVARAERQDLG